MSSNAIYTELLSKIAAQNELWSVSSDSPLTISREDDDAKLPLAISVVNNGEYLCFQLYRDKKLNELANKLLAIERKEQIQAPVDDSGFVSLIDRDGFAVAFNTAAIDLNSVPAKFDDLVNKSETILAKIIKEAIGTVKTAPDEGISSPDVMPTEKISIDKVVEQYFKEKEFNYHHDEDERRYVIGFQTDSYLNSDQKNSLRLVINYEDKGLLRIATPFLYEFDFEKVSYGQIASVIAWYQFEYKFLSMSLDPSDGELKISIDIPLGEGTLHSSQIHRVVSFILGFVDETYPELFELLLNDSNKAEGKLNQIINEYRKKVANSQWVASLGDKISNITDEQKKEIEVILGVAADQQNGI